MIIKDEMGPAFAQSEIADLWLTGKNGAAGTLSVGEWDYDVSVTSEEGRRIWVRVHLAKRIEGEERRKHAMLAIAHLGVGDDAWRPVAVDARDGEVLYSTTLTCDLTSEALDRFFSAARAFLLEHGGEVDAVVHGDLDAAQGWA